MVQKVLLLSVLTLLVAAGAAEAQSPARATITGAVYDESGESIPDATVALYDTTGSELIRGTTSHSDGTFALTAMPGPYLMRISYISYENYNEELSLQAGETVSLGNIRLNQNTEVLGEVEVRAERSSMEMDFDSRKFNVGHDITSMGGSALDVLDNVPSITTDYEGNVSLREAQGVQILINGRPSSLVRNGTDALSAIPANLIKNIEVITNPSARYAAEGTAGIINIVLIDNVELGLNGTISAHSGYPHDHEVGINLNYHVNNINWFFSTDMEYDSRPRSGEIYQLFGSPDTTYIYEQISDSRDYELEGGLRFGADLYLPASQILTASMYLNLEGGEDEEEVIYTDYAIDEELRRRMINENISKPIYPDDTYQHVARVDWGEVRERDFDFSLQYENKINESGEHKLTADLDLDVGREREHSDLTQTIIEGTGDPLYQRTKIREQYRDLRLDLDYERPIGEQGRFEAGYRSSFDWMDNAYAAEEQQNGSWVPLAQVFNDNFTYYENVNALYTIYSGEAEAFGYQIGLRTEQTIISTELKGTDERNKQSYLNLFPSAFLSYQFNEQNSVQASYSRRLRRPWSRMLLPYTSYSDSRNRSSGNPNLKPEFGNSYEAGYLRYWGSGSLLTSVYYRYRTGVFERITTVDSDGIRRRFPINLATKQAWGVEFTADQKLFGGLQLLGSLNLFESHSEGEYDENVLRSETGSFYSRLRARWRLPNGWNYQASLFYRGPRQTTQGRRAGTSHVSSGIAKELFDRKATISLNVRDLFNARRHDEIINEANSYSERDFSWSSRSFRLTFRYHFSSDDMEGQRPGRSGSGSR